MKTKQDNPSLALALRGIIENLEDVLEKHTGGAGQIPAKKTPRSARGRTRGPEAAAPATRSGNRLAIVVGHTASAPGATGVAPISASEYPWNKDLATRIVASGARAGIEVKTFFRDGIGISGAYRQVSQWGATAAIELHFNAFNGTARGTETIYGPAISKTWGQAVQDAMVALYGRTGTLDRKLKAAPPHPRGGESVNALRDIPTCLIEPFFGDNTQDATLGQNKKQQLADTLVATFQRHFQAENRGLGPASLVPRSARSRRAASTVRSSRSRT